MREFMRDIRDGRRDIRDCKRAAAAAAGVAALALFAAAVAYPIDRSTRSSLSWIALPSIEFRSLPGHVEGIDEDMVPVASAVGLHGALAATRFDLRSIRSGDARVPRLFVENMPSDFDAEIPTGERKRLFTAAVLPLILKANEEVLAERRRLIGLEKQILSGRDVPDAAHDWLDRLAAKYAVAPGDFVALLRRVDTVSPSLALAQAIVESGWGRSRFTRQGNALFGQRAWDRGAGLVPEERPAGARFEVRAFPSLLDSVRSYAVNLNRHSAYEDYRTRRAEMRVRAGPLDGRRLAETLAAYSERREAYVHALQGLIETNRLDQFDGAELAADPIDAADIRLASR